MSNMLDNVKPENKRRALMMEAGLSQASVAKSLKIHKSTVCGVVAGYRTSARIKKFIARKLKMKVADLWEDKKKAVNA